MLSGSHNENLRPSYYNIAAEQLGGESCVFPDKQQQLSAQGARMSCLEVEAQSQHADSSLGDMNYGASMFSHGENSSAGKTSQLSMKSWPKLKRKKAEHQQSHTFKARRLHSVKMVPVQEHLESMEINKRVGSLDPFVSKSTDSGTYLEMGSNWEKRSKSSLSSQNGEVYISFFHLRSVRYINFGSSLLDFTACERKFNNVPLFSTDYYFLKNKFY